MHIMKYCFTLISREIVKKSDQVVTTSVVMPMCVGEAVWENHSQEIQKVKYSYTLSITISLHISLGKSCTQENSSQFSSHKLKKETKCLSTEECLKAAWYAEVMECQPERWHSTNESQPYAIKQRNKPMGATILS